MNSKRNLSFLVGVFAALAARDARAAGFAVAEQGAGAVGVGGAATARSDLLEAGFYNPSAFALEADRGPSAWLGVSALAPTLTHLSPEGVETSTEPALSPIPAAHVGGSIGDFGVSASWGVPFGSGLRWPDGWEGRTSSIASSLQVFEGALNVSWRPLDWLAVGAGARAQRGILRLEQGIDAIDPDVDARVTLAGDAWAPAWQAHALARPLDALRVGASYRSGSTLDMSGLADFEGVPRELEARAHDSAFSAAFPTPWRAALGVAWEVGDGVVSADVEAFGWAAFDELVLDFEDEDLEDVRQPRRWSNTLGLRAGYEHALMDEALRVRGGASWDPSPASVETLSPSSPDTDRVGLALGAGWRSSFGLRVDASGSYTMLLDARARGEDAYPGTYSGGILGLSLGVGFTL